jgi:hypothetical protein
MGARIVVTIAQNQHQLPGIEQTFAFDLKKYLRKTDAMHRAWRHLLRVHWASPQRVAGWTVRRQRRSRPLLPRAARLLFRLQQALLEAVD